MKIDVKGSFDPLMESKWVNGKALTAAGLVVEERLPPNVRFALVIQPLAPVQNCMTGVLVNRSSSMTLSLSLFHLHGNAQPQTNRTMPFWLGDTGIGCTQGFPHKAQLQ